MFSQFRKQKIKIFGPKTSYSAKKNQGKVENILLSKCCQINDIKLCHCDEVSQCYIWQVPVSGMFTVTSFSPDDSIRFMGRSFCVLQRGCAVRGPVRSELLVNVVIKPRHEGEQSDGCCCGHSQHAHRRPSRVTAEEQPKHSQQQP